MAYVKKILWAVGLFAFFSAPLHATTIDFATGSTSGTTATSLPAFTGGSISTTLTGYTFGATDPNFLNGVNLSSLQANALLSYSDRGVGVCSATETGTAGGNSGGCPEIDSADEQGRNRTNLNEGLLLSFTGAASVNISSAILNIVDDNDTLGIYGVALDGTLALLGFAGTITNPTGGGFTVTTTGTNTNQQYILTFTPALGSYSRYLFTTMSDGSTPTTGDGYRLQALTVAAVPEPATWAMLIFGFGAIGLRMRRRGDPASRSTNHAITNV